jgi:hypothetical protein
VTEAVLPTALAFAHHGHAVFPVNWPVEHKGRVMCSCCSELRGMPPCGKPAKHPYGILAPNGLLSATTKPGIIKHWFGYRAPQANLGIVTDALVVVDVDPRAGGDESFLALEREHGAMPPTWRALTGGGGEHIIFAAPDGVEIASFAAEHYKDNPPLGRGIDVKARGGYIVAPPSRHISGGVYTWSVDHHPADVPLALAPDWLIEQLVKRTASKHKDANPSEVWQRLTDKVIREYRDMAAAQVAGHLLRRWVDPYLVAGLLHAWNQIYVEPPLSDDELRKILDRIARREDLRRDAAEGGKA